MEPRLLLLLLLKASGGDWPLLSCPSLALLWLRKKLDEEGETGVEMEEGVEKDGTSSTSSMSKDLFSAAGEITHKSLKKVRIHIHFISIVIKYSTMYPL